jgi:hypothetical protein
MKLRIVIVAALLAASCRTTNVEPPGKELPAGLTLEIVEVRGATATLRLVNHSQERFTFRSGAPAKPAAVYESSLGSPWVYYVMSGCGEGKDQTIKPGNSVEFSTDLPARKGLGKARVRVGVQHAGGGFIVWSPPNR